MSAEEAADGAKDKAEGLLGKIKDKAADIAQKVDDKAEKAGEKDGIMGKIVARSTRWPTSSTRTEVLHRRPRRLDAGSDSGSRCC